MAGMAVWILVSLAVKTPLNGHHLHSMGKLLFAFTAFWAYTAFCQFMLIWIADIPDETPWFHMRLFSDWRYVGYFLCVFHFAIPFVILLSKDLKFRPRRLAFMAVWMLVAHAVDCYWIVLPQINQSGPHFNLSDLFAFVGVGGIAIAFFIWRMRGRLLGADRRSVHRLFDGVPPVSQPIQEEDRIATGKIVAHGDRLARHLRRRRRLVDVDPAQREQEHRHAACIRRRSAEAGAPEVGIVYQWPFNVSHFGPEKAAETKSRLEHYSWVDKNAKVVRIPIEQAMEKYVSQAGGRSEAAPSSPALARRRRRSVGACARAAAGERRRRREARRARAARSRLHATRPASGSPSATTSATASPSSSRWSTTSARCSARSRSTASSARCASRRGSSARNTASSPSASIPRRSRRWRCRSSAAISARSAFCPRSTARIGRSSPATRANIDALSDALGFKFRWDDVNKTWDHTAAIMALSPDGKITRYLYGVQYPSHDVKLALFESADGKVGTILRTRAPALLRL